MNRKEYCPYCNKWDREIMSDEDVIPQSIGGDKRTIIRTHKNCNENAGKSIDTLITSEQNNW